MASLWCVWSGDRPKFELSTCLNFKHFKQVELPGDRGLIAIEPKLQADRN